MLKEFATEDYTEKIFGLTSESFEQTAMEVFGFQYAQNAIYRRFCSLLGRNPSNVCSLTDIPFIPIELFKNKRLIVAGMQAEKIFMSSGTTHTKRSCHHVADLKLYERSFLETFRLFYGAPSDYCIIALLPSYLERGDSSLVYMAERLIAQSRHADSGFYLSEYDCLYKTLLRLESERQKTLLLGVTYALLDFAERYSISLEHTLVMETGGMKGRRCEMLRKEVHARLKYAFGIFAVHSEYGMTELLSQAYSKGDGIFYTPPWMRVLIRQVNDPLSYAAQGISGGINIVDLANIYSCAFVATQDIGLLYPDNGFEVLGRFDEADVRGCNLLVCN